MRQLFRDEGNHVFNLVSLSLLFCISENLGFKKIFIQTFTVLVIYIFIFLKSILESLKNYEIQDGGFTVENILKRPMY